MSINSTYLLEIPSMERMDWIARHERLGLLRFRTAQAVEDRMPPDLLLTGRLTGLKIPPGRILALPDKVRVKKPAAIKKRGYKQVHLCKLFSGVCCNKHK